MTLIEKNLQSILTLYVQLPSSAQDSVRTFFQNFPTVHAVADGEAMAAEAYNRHHARALERKDYFALLLLLYHRILHET